jgi:hypothetical protein
MKKLIQILSLMIFSLNIQAQESHMVVPAIYWQKNKWNAQWISANSGPTHEYGVHHFRKKFRLDFVPDSFVINVSADQRYVLFVNGHLIGRGPARGDLLHWYYETFDIAPYLTKGENLISATVWHFGKWTPGAQISQELGLIVQGNSKSEEIVNTNISWKTFRDDSYSPSTRYLKDVGPGDVIDGKKYPWGWTKLDYADNLWPSSVETGRGCPQFVATGYIRALIPRDIPAMESRQEFLPTVRRSKGVVLSPQSLNGDNSVFVAPNTKATILFDQGYLTNTYPTFLFSEGASAKICVTYSESLYTDNNEKGDRNVIEGKNIIGQTDTFHLDGGANREYSPLWFRTYRYLEINIETANEPLVFHSLKAEYTGYPFKETGFFSSNDSQLQKIWEVGWRTARLCAGETYYDCPYYEQLQYVGDTRIQALISLYVSGDDRLMRKAINNLSWSRSFEGILRSRYPAHYDQFIPPFSLYWINMIHDYWMHRTDDAFIRSHISTIKTIIDWYTHKIEHSTGMLGAMPHWNFTDWPKEWPWDENLPIGGVPPGAISGGSSILSLQLSYTLGDAIELMEAYGEKREAEKYKQLKEMINKSVRKNCYNEKRGLIADDIAHTSFSQHASIMGILSDAFSEKEQRQLFKNLMADKSLIQATVYYKFYLFLALKKVGLANKYLDYLDIWKDMIANGLTTFAERNEPSRSDCHAWSASPIYDLLATVCGIRPASPGFKTIFIRPNPGNLSFIKGSVPHPLGIIEVDLARKVNRLIGKISLPKGTSGLYIFQNEKIKLKEGENVIK